VTGQLVENVGFFVTFTDGLVTGVVLEGEIPGERPPAHPPIPTLPAT
jgi:hypothetical protein